MIARIRGDHDTRWGRWRPDATHESSAARVPSTDLQQRVPQAAPKRWGVWRFVAAGRRSPLRGSRRPDRSRPPRARHRCRRRHERGWTRTRQRRSTTLRGCARSSSSRGSLGLTARRCIQAAGLTSATSPASLSWFGESLSTGALRCSSCTRRCGRETGRSCSAIGLRVGRPSIFSPAAWCASEDHSQSNPAATWLLPRPCPKA